MPENSVQFSKKKPTLDWLVNGVLSRLGSLFDEFMGRNWKPSSSLATSELIERLKKLLDSQIKLIEGKGRFVPHNIKLKVQWDKFSVDSEKAIKTLENELLIAAIDHINDHRYQTFEPLKLSVQPDYFTEGVKLQASFDKFVQEESEAEMNVTVPQITVGDFAPESEIETEKVLPDIEYEFAFSIGEKKIEKHLRFSAGKRIGVGRTKESDLCVDDPSVSKIHAALVLTKEGALQLADTGSTNGTFVNGQRIAYGRAVPVKDSDIIRFGTVEVAFRKISEIPVKSIDASADKTQKMPSDPLSFPTTADSEPQRLAGEKSSSKRDENILPDADTPTPANNLAFDHEDKK